MKRTDLRLYFLLATTVLSLIAAGWFWYKGGKPGVTTTDSPVRVVGGSIHAHVKGVWIAVPGKPGSFTTKTATAQTYKHVKVDGWYVVTGGAPDPPDWNGLAFWKIDIVDQNPTLTTEGITLCSNPACNLTGTPPLDTILLTPLAGSTYSNFYQNDLDVPGTDYPAKRFYDASLHVTPNGSPQTDGPGNTSDLYERIKTITITSNVFSGPYTYRCPHGECFIMISSK